MRTQLMGALLAIPALTCGTRAALSHDAQHMHHHAPPPAACQTTALACASVATPAFAPDGKLWLTWVAGGRVSVASSTDHGKTFSEPTTLAATALRSTMVRTLDRRSSLVPAGVWSSRMRRVIKI